MDEDQQAVYGARLRDELAELQAADALGEEGAAVVELDQQSVGRLSRMDALARQAMAQAMARRRKGRRAALEAALARLGKGDYGYCARCDEEIAPKRLDLDPAAALCVQCAR